MEAESSARRARAEATGSNQEGIRTPFDCSDGWGAERPPM